jgi:flagellar basal body-associated protein FliL
MMSLQTWSHIAIFVGVLLTAGGGLGSYYFGKREDEKKEVQSAAAQTKLQKRVNALQGKLSQIQSNTESIDQKISLIFKSSETKKNKWNEVKVSAPVFADYIVVLFRSSSGDISGNARIRGTKEIYPFSTKVNNRLPLAVHNLWLQDKKQYMSNPILEYEITETSDEKNTLSIFSAGYRMSSGM